MAVKVTPEEYVELHSQRLKASLDRIRKGVDKVTVAPGQKAAQKADKWHAKISAAETKEIWRKNTAAVPLEEWKTALRDKGVSRIPEGLDASVPKRLAFAQKLLAYESGLSDKIQAMPDITLEDSVNRAATWIREMARFRK